MDFLLRMAKFGQDWLLYGLKFWGLLRRAFGMKFEAAVSRWKNCHF